MSRIEDLRQKLVDRNTRFPIYLDYQATTPMDPGVLEAMMPYFTTKYGNPHSRTHSLGWESEEGVEHAREQVAKVINATSREIIFTSGATESNNLALKGVAHFYKDRKDHIITVATEHKCVLDVCRHMEQEGFKVTYLGVNNIGLIDLDELKDAITDKTSIVSIMHVSNETGAIQNIREIGKICRDRGVFFHSDIAQSFGKLDIDVEDCNIDLASISGHKIYGPKGIGALYVRKKPRVRLTPLFNGGGQERGMRSGTTPTPLVVGLGKAAEIALDRRIMDYARIKLMSDYFINEVKAEIPDVILNGDLLKRFPGVVNLSFSYVEGESLILALKDLAISSGSACTSSSLEPSYVLSAMHVEEELAHTSIRFGFGRFTTEMEVEYAIALLISKITHLREMSPLWEMVQEGIDLKQINWKIH